LHLCAHIFSAASGFDTSQDLAGSTGLAENPSSFAHQHQGILCALRSDHLCKRGIEPFQAYTLHAHPEQQDKRSMKIAAVATAAALWALATSLATVTAQTLDYKLTPYRCAGTARIRYHESSSSSDSETFAYNDDDESLLVVDVAEWNDDMSILGNNSNDSQDDDVVDDDEDVLVLPASHSWCQEEKETLVERRAVSSSMGMMGSSSGSSGGSMGMSYGYSGKGKGSSNEDDYYFGGGKVRPCRRSYFRPHEA
jgi:hypothetical protein